MNESGSPWMYRLAKRFTRFQPYFTSYDQVTLVSWLRLPWRSSAKVKVLS